MTETALPTAPAASGPAPVRRLTRSRSDRKIAGVCGGLAEYFGVDPTLVRVIAIVLALVAGGGVLAYLLAWLVMPNA